MIKRVVISALEDLQQSWRPVFPVQITFSRSEVNPQFVAIVPHSEVVVVVTFDVEMGRAPMSITLCIPYSMIEPIRAKLNAGFQSDQNEVDTTWLNRFRTNLQSAKVEVVVELGKSEVNVRDFLALKTGDLVTLDQEVDKPLEVTVEGITKFRGYQGSYKGRQAVKISEFVYKPPIVDEILLL
jgi:flagellar motor switch protein FliM